VRYQFGSVFVLLPQPCDVATNVATDSTIPPTQPSRQLNVQPGRGCHSADSPPSQPPSQFTRQPTVSHRLYQRLYQLHGPSPRQPTVWLNRLLNCLLGHIVSSHSTTSQPHCPVDYAGSTVTAFSPTSSTSSPTSGSNPTTPVLNARDELRPRTSSSPFTLPWPR
jgi:hypothetical protein